MGKLKKLLINSPILLTLAVYLIGYYVYFTYLLLFDTFFEILSASFLHLFFLFSILSFLGTLITDPGEIPASFHIESIPEDQKEVLKDNYLEIDFSLARITFCKKCDKYRPPRTHHCSTCGKCILRYDHHCPFIANCIGFKNQKSFILFLLYSGLCLLILTIESFKYLLENPETFWY